MATTEQINGKIKKIISYLQDIIDTTKKYSPNELTTKDLKNIPNAIDNAITEMENTYIDRYTNLSYGQESLTSPNYIMLQVPYYNGLNINTTFTMKGGRTTITKANSSDLYDTINQRVTVSDVGMVMDLANDENWKGYNIKIRCLETTESFTINNQQVICVKASFGGITSLANSFADNQMLRVVHLNNLDECKDMSYCFKNDSSLVNLKADLSKVENLEGLLYNCINLISLPDLDLSSCINATDMFFGCTNLRQIIISPNCTSIPNGLDISYCTKMTINDTMNFLNSLPLNNGDRKNIYIPMDLSYAQLNAFLSRGYKVAYKKN